MNAKSFHLSVQGASHIKKKKECQDASKSYYNENRAIAVVCDGHGGDDYMRSAFGALFGAEVAERNIQNFLNTVDKDGFFRNPEEHMRNLKASIISGWNGSVYNHFESHPFTEEELGSVSEKARTKYSQGEKIESAYGTTMIAVAMTRDFWFGIHIGDGKCVAVNPEGKFVQPIPWDSKCFLNATTSICDSDALQNFRHFYSEKLPAAVFVGSDGVDDCFSNNEQLHNLYKTILYSFGTSEFNEAVDGLRDYLPRLSAKGSGDDVSVAAMLDMELIPTLEMVKEFDREKEKARIEEKVRMEAEKNEAEKKRIEKERAKFQQENRRYKKMTDRAVFCVKCGVKLIPGMKFCGECGAKIPRLQEDLHEKKSIQVIPIQKFDAENMENVEEIDSVIQTADIAIETEMKEEERTAPAEETDSDDLQEDKMAETPEENAKCLK